MIFLGVVVLIVGAVTSAPVVWISGLVVLLIGIGVTTRDAARRYRDLEDFAKGRFFGSNQLSTAGLGM